MSPAIFRKQAFELWNASDQQELIFFEDLNGDLVKVNFGIE